MIETTVNAWEDVFKTYRFSSEAGLPFALWYRLLLEKRLPFVGIDQWRTDISLDKISDYMFKVREKKDRSILYEHSNGSLVSMRQDSTFIWIRIASSDEASANEIIAELKSIFVEPAISNEPEIPVTFWTYSAHGPTSTTRNISVPSWDQISHNYASDVRPKIDTLIKSFQPGVGGKLSILTGEPGSGKTTLLRTLGFEWRNSIDFHYIVDPEVFFGSSSDYMMSVIMASNAEYSYNELTGEVDEIQPDNEKWKLLILEDVQELLEKDAKAQSGQGLSRLLNVVDGFIGQGLKILILATTNEKMKSMHPAIARPGRCAVTLEINKLEEEDVLNWYQVNNLEVPETIKPSTVAELYARTAGYELPTATEQKIGFR